MRLFLMTDETAREEMGDWLRNCCSGHYGLTFNASANCMQVAIIDDIDATAFRLAFSERITEFGSL